ncbi:MAG: replication-associated recombination protein A [Lentisphaerae bacterium]|nr:replication-associated recombination protein A [Lentisphaerota bacterium]
MDLFDDKAKALDPTREPLASRMRPCNLDEVVGQERILGAGRLLRRAIEADRLSSIILYGPPGCGKTSIAEVIARATSRHFERASGVTANVAVLRGLFELAAHHRRHDGVETILFIDEIHRFSKSQQDVLLPHVEDGTITLIGATTHNPQFFINSPLISRSLIFELDSLSVDAIVALLERALREERGLALTGAVADREALEHLATVCEGDARRALNALEVAVLTTEAGADGNLHVTREVAEDSIQRKAVLYDRDEEGHYDTISAFIKSVRGSDPQAAVYWLAKMLYAGEDPRFIARRLVILASEDIGNADPRGLTMAVSAMQGVEFVGMPEARIVLSQATTYLATAPKSNAAYVAVDEAMKDVEEGRSLAVPLHLRNVKVTSVDGAASAEYVYPHNCEGHFTEQQYAGTDRTYYRPSAEGYEETLRKRMAHWDALREMARPSA